VYEPRIVASLATCGFEFATTVDESWRTLWEVRMADPLADAETLRIDGDGCIRELGRKPTSYDEIEGQYMGLIGVAAAFAPRLVDLYCSLDPSGPYDGRDRDNMYMTSFLQTFIDLGTPLHAVRVRSGWLEVDTAADLELYEALQRRSELGRYCVLA
jgi:choline kinase